MADEKRVLLNFARGTITDNPLTSGATTINSAEFAALPALATDEHFALVLDPLATGNGPEIVILTAHSSSATSATATRGAEGTTGVEHAAGTPWILSVVRSLLPRVGFGSHTQSGNISLTSTSWADVHAALEATIPAQAGDIILVAVHGQVSNAAVNSFFDGKITTASSTTYLGSASEPSSGGGLIGWLCVSGQFYNLGPPVLRRILAGDVSGGLLTIRLRYRNASGTAREFYVDSSSGYTAQLVIMNLGPQAVWG